MPAVRWLVPALGVALMLATSAGLAIGATYPPRLTPSAGAPGVSVLLGPHPSEPWGVPLAADCAAAAARSVARPAPDTPGNQADGERLPGVFGTSDGGWLTFRFEVPRVAPGVIAILILCDGIPTTSTADADGPGFLVLPSAPATDALGRSASQSPVRDPARALWVVFWVAFVVIAWRLRARVVPRT
jgi:hypothetical protein